MTLVRGRSLLEGDTFSDLSVNGAMPISRQHLLDAQYLLKEVWYFDQQTSKQDFKPI